MILKIANVTKVIKKTTVVDHVSAKWKSGKVYGLCGYNGCGKTMLMRLIAGLIKPTSGSIKIDGKELGKDIDFPESIGLLIENPAFLDNYTGFENLKLIAGLSPSGRSAILSMPTPIPCGISSRRSCSVFSRIISAQITRSGWSVTISSGKYCGPSVR